MFLGLTIVTYADDACYATIGYYSWPCKSSNGYVGSSPSDTIYYSINVISDTAVYCYALAASTCPAQSCEWQRWDIGLVNDGTNLLIWGNNAGVPQT